MKKSIKTFAIFVLIPVILGFLSSFFVGDVGADYEMLFKPPLSPSSSIFPIVWTILYILMGIASYLVYTSDGPQDEVQSALSLYFLSLAVNVVWPFIFFRLDAYFIALLWLVLLLVLVVAVTKRFFAISKVAGILMVPYVLWLIFAGYLNLFIYLYN